MQKATSEAVTTPTKTQSFKSIPVDHTIKSQLEKLGLGKIRLPRQSKTEYGKQRDLSGYGETGETPTSAYFPPSGCRLVAEASDDAQFPAEGLPEVCFVGRSNVGKSSLLNAIVGYPLSKTSSKPGETTNLRWYNNSDLITLVDLPGYGFSFAQENRSGVWMEAVKRYLQHRKSLKRCFILIDSRQPLKRSDDSTMQFLEESKVTYQLVLTKADLVGVGDLAKRVSQLQSSIKERFPHAVPDVLVVSSQNRSGLSLLRKQLISLFNPERREAFGRLRDKKFAAAERRRAKRAVQAEHQHQVELHEQRRHSRRALMRQVRSDRKAAESRAPSL